MIRRTTGLQTSLRVVAGLVRPLARKKNMQEDDFLERWTPLETSLRALEDRYRTERLRKNGKPYPEGSEADKLLLDLSAVCKVYIDASETQRENMRDLFKWSYLLPTYLLSLVRLPKDTLSPDEVVHAAHVALAAASLEDNKTDYRDMFLALGRVYCEVAAAGLDSELLFQEAAEWSSNKSGTGPKGQSMSFFLSNFKNTEFFRTSVKHRLTGA